ncbi:hypothetical protein DFP72DRAFT_849884 [Ephemerocybe angulata]|uniref:Uncharacterized protein n=1 Tax=Ephemerocybe angulata TaxID=980116 RepID=A0A8H6HSK3_9AGAR|nr:hypothetical protein DFP72DRAFT_849884 [Tulosesus angulatus]
MTPTTSAPKTRNRDVRLLKGIVTDPALDSTVEGDGCSTARCKVLTSHLAMNAYRLALQILRARNTERWGAKALMQDDMRSTFAWLYILLKHDMKLPRKLVTSRVNYRARRPKGSKGKDARPGVTWASTEGEALIDYELLNTLGFNHILVGDTRTFNSQEEVNCCLFNLLYDPQSNDYRLEQATQVNEGPYTALAPLLFGITLSGSPFTGGRVEVDTPFVFLRRVGIEVKTGDEVVIGKGEAILSSTGDKYSRSSSARIPEDIFDSLSLAHLGDITFQMDANGIFVLNAIHVLFPSIQPATGLRIRVILGFEWDEYGIDAQSSQGASGYEHNIWDWM